MARASVGRSVTRLPKKTIAWEGTVTRDSAPFFRSKKKKALDRMLITGEILQYPFSFMPAVVFRSRSRRCYILKVPLVSLSLAGFLNIDSLFKRT